MSVVTVKDVELASGVLRVGPRDVITPLAHDRAKELGIRIERDATVAGPPREGAVARPQPPPAAPASHRGNKATIPRAAGAPPQPATRPAPERSGALYRRGAYGPHGDRTVRAPAASTTTIDGRPRVAVVGAGHVGASTALRLAESDRFANVTMIDVVPGLAAGLALDIWHSAALRGFTSRVDGSDDLAALDGADVVVITAGKPRKPGMSRTDLTAANADIVRAIAPAIASRAPNAVVVVVTNPLEEMTHLVCTLTGFAPERVVGMGGVLDAARFRSLVGLSGRVRPEDVHAFVLGSHGAEMVIPLSQATANGVPLERTLDRATLDAIVQRTRESGAEVTALLQSGSAFFSPATAIAAQVLAVVEGSAAIVPACVRSRGAYGTVDTRVGLPVRLGREGVREVVSLPLEPEELRELREAARAIDARIASMR